MANSNSTGKKITTTSNPYKGRDVESLKLSFVNHLEYSLAKDEYSATKNDLYHSLALTTRDRMTERWIETQQTYYDEDVKRVYYLSLEFLIGRTLGNSLINTGTYENADQAMSELEYDFCELLEEEWDAGLGNGGLGRLAACFMDSLATLEIPAVGYGIRYEYGIFFQRIIDGFQQERPDPWLRLGNPWEIGRPEFLYPVRFYGKVNQYRDSQGNMKFEWIDTDEVMAMGYDTPIPGYNNNTVNNMRLWAAKSSRGFSLDFFNDGDYEKAVSDKAYSENISRVLYPNDNIFEGKELRLKQQYFFVSATIQDMLRRFKKHHSDLKELPDKVAVQLNDTHPAIAIPELMRVLLDEEGLDWDTAWDISCNTFAYTNHTVLPEALENWPVSLIELVLPRHIQIIYEINMRFLKELGVHYPGDFDRLRRMSIIAEDGDKKVRMAFLAIIGSHTVNGVAAVHTEIIKRSLFKDFYELWPEKFQNKTNGITQRRWLKFCNRSLADLINSRIGDGWVKDLEELRKLEEYADDPDFQKEWRAARRNNKVALAEMLKNRNGIIVDPDSMFDSHIKRIHEYKRQLMNVFHLVTLYNRIKDNPDKDFVPRTVLFSGKAAPGYHEAKMIIKLINCVADMINRDQKLKGRLNAAFIENYSVSLAEKIIPATDLSQQISKAGMEASGTGNMKFMLNGSLTIATLDGANIEMAEEAGDENIFLFGLKVEEVEALERSGYNPRDFYNLNPELKRVIDMIYSGYFNMDNPDLFKPLMNSLLNGGDRFLVLADYESYIKCQEKVNETWNDPSLWERMSILNTARSGKFSSDRTIKQYADEIWGVKPVPIKLRGEM